MEEDGPKLHKGRYQNPHIDQIYRKPKDFLLWMVGAFRDPPFELVPEGFSFPVPDLDFDPKKPWAMWMGHSSYLVSVSGRNLLTDPIWSHRCSPLPFFGPKRRHPAPLPIDQLPPIDYVLISHDHYDHLDLPSVRRLHEQYPKILWVVPKGVKKWFHRQEIKNVVELNWWESVSIDSNFKVTAVPAQHFSGRKSTHVNKTLWAGYVVEELLDGKTFYFVGDTGYNERDFKQIRENFSSIDLSLIPIGSYSPRKFMGPVHVEPKDAVKIHQDVGSILSLAMHWKTFRLSEEPLDQPPFDLLKALQKAQINPSDFLAPEPGHKINW